MTCRGFLGNLSPNLAARPTGSVLYRSRSEAAWLRTAPSRASTPTISLCRVCRSNGTVTSRGSGGHSVLVAVLRQQPRVGRHDRVLLLRGLAPQFTRDLDGVRAGDLSDVVTLGGEPAPGVDPQRRHGVSGVARRVSPALAVAQAGAEPLHYRCLAHGLPSRCTRSPVTGPRGVAHGPGSSTDQSHQLGMSSARSSSRLSSAYRAPRCPSQNSSPGTASSSQYSAGSPGSPLRRYRRSG